MGSCNVTLALTSDACFKGLPKNTNGEVVTFKVTAIFVIFELYEKRIIKFFLLKGLAAIELVCHGTPSKATKRLDATSETYR